MAFLEVETLRADRMGLFQKQISTLLWRQISLLLGISEVNFDVILAAWVILEKELEW